MRERPDPTDSRAVATLVRQLDDQLQHGSAVDAPVALGFPLLDEVLAGGVRPGQLALVGGPPGVGKTVATLQWARSMARAGTEVVYACYEHEPRELLVRLLSIDAHTAGSSPGDVEKLRRRLDEQTRTGLWELLEDLTSVGEMREELESYAHRLHLVGASGAHTDLEALSDLAAQHDAVLFVDYLQKVAVRPEPASEADKVTHVAEGLKEIALSRQVPVISVVATDQRGLEADRVRLHHLRGSSAMVYESDVVLMLNEKTSAVSKVHLSYDPVRAETFRDQVVFSLDKNRAGPSGLDLEFRKDFAHFRFDPDGDMVSEQLVDERLDIE